MTKRRKPARPATRNKAHQASTTKLVNRCATVGYTIDSKLTVTQAILRGAANLAQRGLINDTQHRIARDAVRQIKESAEEAARPKPKAVAP